jgi:hypothetical protein
VDSAELGQESKYSMSGFMSDHCRGWSSAPPEATQPAVKSVTGITQVLSQRLITLENTSGKFTLILEEGIQPSRAGTGRKMVEPDLPKRQEHRLLSPPRPDGPVVSLTSPSSRTRAHKSRRTSRCRLVSVGLFIPCILKVFYS